MRPPFIEATALLAAAGHAPLSPADLVRKPVMPQGVRFALFRQPERPSVKPMAFPSLDALGRHIHRQRRGDGIQLVNQTLQLGEEARARHGVNIWTLTDMGERREYLGWAWLDGGDRQVLERTLFALRPQLGRAA